MERVAQCQCGQLRAVATDEPDFVVMCHCIECQRRTGAVFGTGAYYEKSRVRIEGASKLYTRDGQEGRKFRIHFCPNCGSSIYWDGDFRLTHYGIAVGGIRRPNVPFAINISVRTVKAFLGGGSPRHPAPTSGSSGEAHGIEIVNFALAGRARYPVSI